MYADDTKIYLDVGSANDCNRLQADLNNLSNYYLNNRIKVNIKKCQIITFTRKRNPVPFDYVIQGTPIDRTNLVRDLGVYFDSKLTMSHHIDIITTRALQSLGFVMRTCKPFKDPNSIKVIYSAYVRSTLEYASPIWYPQYVTYIHQVERIQKKFINFLNYKTKSCFKSYEESCNHHNLLTLSQRRCMIDMVLLFDILDSRLDCPTLLSDIGYCVPRKRTRHTKLFHVPLHGSNYTKNSILTRLASNYNKRFSAIDPYCTTKLSFRRSVLAALRAGED